MSYHLDDGISRKKECRREISVTKEEEKDSVCVSVERKCKSGEE